MYCIGEKFDFVIKTSIPEETVTTGDKFFFETRMHFPKESFKKFDQVSRIPDEAFELITKEIGIKYFGLNLFGVDILLQEETGNIYLIDVNYFSSYDGLKRLDVHGAFKDLIKKTYKAKPHYF